MVSDSVFEAVCCGFELLTVRVTLKVPALVGVPPNPPPWLKVKPGGRPEALHE